MKIYEGKFNAQGLKFAVVASRFNELFTSKLVGGADDALLRHGAAAEDIHMVWVPGAFEIPLAAQKLAASGKYDAIICLGAVIRGNTPHFDYVCAEVTKGVSHVGLKYNMPIIFGVITTEDLEQAMERSGTKAGNKGFDAAMSAIEMANLMKEI